VFLAPIMQGEFKGSPGFLVADLTPRSGIAFLASGVLSGVFCAQLPVGAIQVLAYAFPKKDYRDTGPEVIRSGYPRRVSCGVLGQLVGLTDYSFLFPVTPVFLSRDLMTNIPYGRFCRLLCPSGTVRGALAFPFRKISGRCLYQLRKWRKGMPHCCGRGGIETGMLPLRPVR
jgi:hypothetical protein